MRPQIQRTPAEAEYFFNERCWILESWNDASDDDASIARARVEAGVTTKTHFLHGVVERYLIVEGSGLVTIGDQFPERVVPGDVVIIPPEVNQKIYNDGPTDLVFYCFCTPRFTPACYESLD